MVVASTELISLRTPQLLSRVHSPKPKGGSGKYSGADHNENQGLSAAHYACRVDEQRAVSDRLGLFRPGDIGG